MVHFPTYVSSHAIFYPPSRSDGALDGVIGSAVFIPGLIKERVFTRFTKQDILVLYCISS